jgi:hypothetical protein
MDLPPELNAWTAWIPLSEAPKVVAKRPGLYRIRRLGFDGIDYIGQTGSGTMTLRKRLAMLSGLYLDVMPYRDPHTAGPGLWALRHATGADFEASVTVVEGDTPWRKGLEALAVSLYRAEWGVSPTLNFGRIPAGYRGSSANNARLVAAGRRHRGGPCTDELPTHLPGVPPAGPLGGDSCGPTWGGHRWSAWAPASATGSLSPPGLGLYRLARPYAGTLVYVGEGAISARVAAHLAKSRIAGHRQAPMFAGPLICSFVANPTWLDHQRLELENDLIAAHVLTTGRVPSAQFLG